VVPSARHDQPATSKLNSVPGSRGDNAPCEVRAECVESRGNFHWRGKCPGVIAAAHIEDAHVFQAEEEMHGAGAIGDGYLVVVRYVGGLACLRSMATGFRAIGPVA
jgi:hypothetical protein